MAVEIEASKTLLGQADIRQPMRRAYCEFILVESFYLLKVL
jgi:hypothetical protein